MFRVRAIPVVAGLMTGLLLSACSGTSGNFDPTDWITGEFFSTKTPLPGERKPVFPSGVPGVPEGVPPELVKGNQQTVVEATAPSEPAPAAKPAQPARPPVTRPAPKPRTASAPPHPAPVRAAPAAKPAQPATANQPAVAWPEPTNPPAPRPAQSTAPAANWPDPNTQANWPPPDPNAFSR
jgi:outer membrane biosynthesis protein TonB